MRLDIPLPERWVKRHETVNAWVLAENPDREIDVRSTQDGWEIYASDGDRGLRHVTTITRYTGSELYLSDAHVSAVTKHVIRQLAHRIEQNEPGITRSNLESPVDGSSLEKHTRENVTAGFEAVEAYIADEYGIPHSRTPVEATVAVSVIDNGVVSLTADGITNVSVGSVVVAVAGDDNSTFQTIVTCGSGDAETLTLQGVLAGLEIAANAAIDTVHVRIEGDSLVQQLQSICPEVYDVDHTGHTHFKLCGEFHRHVTAFDFTIETLSEETRETAREPGDEFIAELTEATTPYTEDALTDAKERVSRRPNTNTNSQIEVEQ